MQLKPYQLLQQQAIMAHLGFYKHRIDGIWGPESIKAKKEWEFSKEFVPAFPNNGLPFAERDKLPRGMSLNREERVFMFNTLTKEKLEELLKKQGVQQETKPVAPVVEPKAEEPVKIAEEQSKAEEPKEADKQGSSQPNVQVRSNLDQKRFNNKNKHHR